MANVPPPLPGPPPFPNAPRRVSRDEERRAYPRLQLSVTVNFESAHNFYCGKTRDISAGGLFIESDVPLPVGTLMTVELHLLKTRVRAETEVMWVLIDEEGRSVGMGVRFLHLPDRIRDKIVVFMGLRQAMMFEMDLEDDREGDDLLGADGEQGEGE